MFPKNGHALIVAWVVLANTRFAECTSDDTCFSSGSIAGAIIGTLIVTLALLCAAFFIWKFYWKTRKGKHLVLETDPENGDQYAFDNPCFKDAGMSPLEKNGNKLDISKSKWTHWSPISALSSNKSDKRKTFDDSIGETKQVNLVSLRSHDFTGLGFNIQGNMRDGIFVKDVLHRGPASESGKVSSGDRIVSVKISFGHMVYEDALTILSYASPYEVQLELESSIRTPTKSSISNGISVKHPMYRSSSSGDLNKIDKSVRQRSFNPNADETSSTNSSNLKPNLDKSNTSNNSPNTLTKPERTKKPKPYSPSQLKARLEQNFLSNDNKLSESHQKSHHEKAIDVPEEPILQVENEKTDSNKNRLQKFGVRVLPPTNNESPKQAERSQNENNMNFERHKDMGTVDEVDNVENQVLQNHSNELEPAKSQINQEFIRQNSINGSGIKRDKAGIPQEIPDHMLNAAVAARKNRKSTEVAELDNTDISENHEPKVIKKSKGKAPAPPSVMKNEEVLVEKKNNPPDVLNVSDTFECHVETLPSKQRFSDNFVVIENDEKVDELLHKNVDETRENLSPKSKTPIINVIEAAINSSVTEDLTTSDQNVSGNHNFDYSSDSDADTDQNSVINNTIELNSSDITIHHSLGNSEVECDDVNNENRKAASLGDLSKYKGTRVTTNGTLERAQSLDISDSGIPNLSKKRKATNRPEEEVAGENFNSDEYLYSNSLLKSKEPRLSLALDNLSTFQRNRLKKASQWGNLEDAIANITTEVVQMDNSNEEDISDLVKTNTDDYMTSVDVTTGVLKEIIANAEDMLARDNDDIPKIIFNQVKTTVSKTKETENLPRIVTDEILLQDKNFGSKHKNIDSEESSKAADMLSEPNDKIIHDNERFTSLILNQYDDTKDRLEMCLKNTSESLISNEKFNAENPILTEKFSLHLASKLYDTNVSDDIKVSRHSLGSLERPKSDVLKNVNKLKQLQSMIQSDIGGVSNVTVTTDEVKSEMLLSSQTENVAPITITAGANINSDVIADVNINGTNISVEREFPQDFNNITHFQVTTGEQDGTISELYTTAIDTSLDPTINISENTVAEDTKIKVTLEKSSNDATIINTSDFEQNSDSVVSSNETFFNGNDLSPVTVKTTTFVTEIEVSPNSRNVSEITVNNGLIENEKQNLDNSKSPKKLSEMKFSFSSNESTPISTDKRHSQIEVLRSNFENKNHKLPASPSKSKIPIATSKTSPEKVKHLASDQDGGDDKEIIDIMSKTSVHSTPLSSQKHSSIKNPIVKNLNNKNVTVTSIRSSSKIPSGQFTAGNYPSRPPVPPRRNESDGPINSESTFQQWVFTPSSESNIVIETKKD